MSDFYERPVKDLLRQNKVIRPPVPVEKIAELLGLDVRLAPLDGDVSGAIIRSNNSVVIGVNSSHHPNRQRFTIAHEIAHFILHKGVTVHIDRAFNVNLRDGRSSGGIDAEEIQANRFAAELLMPKDFLLKDFVVSNDDGEEMAARLARRYRVSPRQCRFASPISD